MHVLLMHLEFHMKLFFASPFIPAKNVRYFVTSKSETGRWAPRPFDEDQPCQRSAGKHDTVISSAWSECIHSALKLMTVLQKWRISSRGLNLTPPHLKKKNKQPTWMVIFGHLFATSLIGSTVIRSINTPGPIFCIPKSLGLQGLDAAAFVDNSHWIDVFVSLGDTQVGTIQAVHAAKEMY